MSPATHRKHCFFEPPTCALIILVLLAGYGLSPAGGAGHKNYYRPEKETQIEDLAALGVTCTTDSAGADLVVQRRDNGRVRVTAGTPELRQLLGWDTIEFSPDEYKEMLTNLVAKLTLQGLTWKEE